MKIKYLGTAAAEGCPAPFCNCELCKAAQKNGGRDIRTRSQALIDGELLVDFPADTYHHFLTTPDFDLPAICHILITHSHSDHFYPLDIALRCRDFAKDIEGTLTLYGNETVHGVWEKTVNESSMPEDLAEHVDFVELKPFCEVLVGSKWFVTALPANHKKNENCYIYLIRRDNKCLFYANDTGISLVPEVWSYLEGRHIDAVSMDCTAMDRRVGRYHMGLPDNLELKERLTQLGCVDEDTKYVVTHFSHFGALQHNELAERAQKLGFIAAYDGMELEF